MWTPRHRWSGVVLLSLTILSAGCSASSSGTAASPAAPTPLVVPGSPSAAPTTSPSGSLPPEAAAVQGGKYYAVFLAVVKGATNDSIATARQRAKALGYEGGDGDIECTPGAREQLHLSASGSYIAFSVFFATKAQAQQFATAYGKGVVGVAYVTGGCLD